MPDSLANIVDHTWFHLLNLDTFLGSDKNYRFSLPEHEYFIAVDVAFNFASMLQVEDGFPIELSDLPIPAEYQRFVPLIGEEGW